MTGSRGAILYETLLMVSLLAGVLFFVEMEVLHTWKERMERLQECRLTYDGLRRP